MPTSLDEFLPILSTTDTKIKLSIGAKLQAFLQDSSNSIECSDIGQFIDSLVSWLQSSNYKVAQNSLEILTELVSRMKCDFQTYLPSVLSFVVDKLGDSKESIREKAFALLMKMIEHDVSTAQQLLDKIAGPAFQHKNSNVREQMMLFVTTVLDMYGPQSVHISKFVPYIVKLLSDPNSSVRSTAFRTLVNIYKHVGERLRADLQKKYSIPQNKLPSLMQAFDDLKLLSDSSLTNSFSSSLISGVESNIGRDELDNVNSYSALLSAPPPPSPFVKPSDNKITTGISSSNSNSTSLSRKLFSSSGSTPGGGGSASINSAGAIDDEAFLASFEDVPSMRIYSGKDVEEFIRKASGIIDNVNADWNKRVEHLKLVRACVLADGLRYDEFHSNMNILLPAFHTAIKDLRSQLVREACLTVAFLSMKLGMRFDHFAESLLNGLINLIQNSAKVVSSSGLVCIHFLLRYTHSTRLIPIVTSNMKSKSKEIRRACCEFVYFILQNWHGPLTEKNLLLLKEAIKKGIADADQEARTYSRKAYWLFSEHFPDKAEQLLNSLDGSYKKLLTLNVPKTATTTGAVAADSLKYYYNNNNSNSNSNSGSNSHSTKAVSGHYNGAEINAAYSDGYGTPAVASSSRTVKISPRSNSAVDLQAAKRAQVRAQYAALARSKASAASAAAAAATFLPKPSKRLPICAVNYASGNSGAALRDQQILERAGRTKNRMSISQPTSRSSSPSSKFSYNTNLLAGSPVASATPPGSGATSVNNRSQQRRCLHTAKSRSTNTSREPSPNRFAINSSSNISSSNSNYRINSRIPTTQSPLMMYRQPVLAQRILQQSQEAESALTDDGNFGFAAVNNSSLLSSGNSGCWSSSSSPFYHHHSLNSSNGSRRLFNTNTRSLDEHNSGDESESSSICSDLSFDFHRKSIDSPSQQHYWGGSDFSDQLYSNLSSADWKPSFRHANEIIALCKSPFWNERKDGLISVQYYIDSGGVFTLDELKQLMDVFVKIFNDPHTKVFGLYLDALNKLMVSHHRNLHYCLRLLLTRLLTKLGGDILNSVQAKIMKTLDTVLITFPADLQLHSVFQFLVDPTQTPNAQVKIAILNYITRLTYMTDPALLFNSCATAADNNSSSTNGINKTTAAAIASPDKKDYANLAFLKIVDWIVADDSSVKSRVDVRKAAEDCMIALFNLNTPEVTFRLGMLSYERQQRITDFIKAKLNDGTSSSSGGNVGESSSLDVSQYRYKSPPPSSNSKSRSPADVASISNGYNRSAMQRLEESESSAATVVSNNSSSGGPTDDTYDNIDVALSKLNLSIRETLSNNRFNEHNNNNVSADNDGILYQHAAAINSGNEDSDNSGATVSDDSFRKLLDALSSAGCGNDSQPQLQHQLSESAKMDLLLQMEKALLPEQSTASATGASPITADAIVTNFKVLLRLLLSIISNDREQPNRIEAALYVLQHLASRKTFTACFKDYIELILLKVMNVSKNSASEKNVVRAVENCAIIFSMHLPVEYTVRVVIPLVTSDDYPINLLAIKMLTRLVQRSKDSVAEHISQIMPSLLTAYDNSDSCVRKSAVFCMVALHSELGESALAPYINTLSGAKLKLLQLYIEKNQKSSTTSA